MAFSRNLSAAHSFQSEAPHAAPDLDMSAANASVVSVGPRQSTPGTARLDMAPPAALQPLQVDPLDPSGWRQDPSAVAERVVFRLWADGAVSGRSIEQARRELDGRTRLDQALVKLGVVEEEIAARALYAEIGARIADEQDFPISPVESVDLPPRFVRETLVAPLADDGSVIRVAMADPLDDYALRAIAMKTRRRLEILAAPPRMMRAQIDRLYGASPAPTRPPARMLGAERPRRALPPPAAAGQARAGSRLSAASEGAAQRTRSAAHRPAAPTDSADAGPKPSFVRPQRVTFRNRAATAARSDRGAERAPARAGDEGALARAGEKQSARMRERRSVVDEARRAAVEVAENWREPAREALGGRENAPTARSRAIGAPIELDPRDDLNPRRGLDPRAVETARRRRFVGGFVGGFIGPEPARAPTSVALRAERSAGGGGRPSPTDQVIDAHPLDAARPLEDRLNDIGARLRERQIEPTPARGRDVRPAEATPRVTRRDLRIAQRRSRHQRARELVMWEIRRSLRKETSRALAAEVVIGDAAPTLEIGLEPNRLEARAPAPSGGSDTLRSPHQRPANETLGQAVRHPLALPGPSATSRADLAEADPHEQKALAVLSEIAKATGGLVLCVGDAPEERLDALRRCAELLSGGPAERFDSVTERGGGRSGCDADGAPRVVFGEINDASDAEAAARLAMTGGVVLAALSAPTAAAAAPSLVTFGLPPYAVASSLRAILTLAPKEQACSICGDAVATGCAQCGGSGGVRTTGLAEVVEPDDTFRALILASAPEAAFGHALAARASDGAAAQGPRTRSTASRAPAEAALDATDRLADAFTTQASEPGRGVDRRAGGGSAPFARRKVTAGPLR